MAKRRENIENLIRSVQDEISIYRTNPEWSEFYNINNIENDELNSSYEIAMQAFYDIINNDFKDPEQIAKEYENDYADYIQELYNGIKEKFNNAKTIEEVFEIWNNNVETIPEQNQIESEFEELANILNKTLERLSNGQTGVQSESKTNIDGQTQRTSESNFETAERSNGNNISNLESEYEVSGNKENITTDTKLYQETDQTETEAFKKWFGDSKVVDESNPYFQARMYAEYNHINFNNYVKFH